MNRLKGSREGSRDGEGSRERVEGGSGCCLICRGGNEERREWMFVGMEWAKPSLKYSSVQQLEAQFWDPKVTGNKKGDRCAACLALGEAEKGGS